MGSANITDLPPLCGQLGGCILEGHRPREPEGLLGADIGRYAHATDCRPAGDVVDCDDSLEPDGRPVNVDQFQGPEVVGEAKYVLHHTLSEGLID